MTYDELLERARSFQESRLLLTAIELDVFAAVGAGADAAAVAATIQADGRATEMLLNALVSVGALAKDGGVFRNLPAVAEHLSGPNNERAGLMHTVNLWGRWSTLTEAVREGTPVWRRTAGRPDAAATEAFIAAMHRNAAARAPQVVAAAGVAGVARLLDVGGGSGAYSIAFAQASPEIRTVVLDRPEVLAITRRHIAAAGLAERVSTLAGDLTADEFPGGHDLVLVLAICHMLGPEGNRDLFRRVHDALTPGGRIVIQDFLLNAEKTAPRAAALFSLNMLVGTEHGASYSEPEYRAWLTEAGFGEIRVVPLDEASGLVIATKPKN